MSIADKMNYLLETKNQIKEAIKSKDVAVSDTDTFRSYANKISEIQSGINIDTVFTSNVFLKSTDTSTYIVQSILKSIPKNIIVEIFKKLPNKSAKNMFSYCRNLEEIDLSDCNTSLVINFDSTFNYCYKLARIKGIIDSISTTNNYMNTFYMCENLEEVYVKNLHDNIYLTYSPKIKKECLVYLLNNAQEVTETKRIVLGSTNKAKLTAEEIAIGTNKGYTIS